MSLAEFDALAGAGRGAGAPARESRAVPRDALTRDALSRADPASPPDADPDEQSSAPGPALRTRSRLSIAPVAAPAPAPRRLPFVLTVVALLVTGLGGLLVLNTVMAQDSFRASRLADQSAQLQAERQALSEQVDRLQSPESLTARAGKLGLKPQTDPPILDLGTGKVIATRR